MSLEWKSECVIEGKSSEQVGGELESVTSSAGCFVQGSNKRKLQNVIRSFK